MNQTDHFFFFLIHRQIRFGSSQKLVQGLYIYMYTVKPLNTGHCVGHRNFVRYSELSAIRSGKKYSRKQLGEINYYVQRLYNNDIPM